jgi:hypothetical protein
MMTRIAFLLALCGSPVSAQDTPAPASTADPLAQIIRPAMGETLDAFLWIKRPVLVFADSAADPRYIQQMARLTERLDELDARDVIVLTDTDPAGRSEIRKALRPRGFQIVLIGKDGQIKLRKPVPWDVRELSRVIDKMPMRQQEVRDKREGLIE